MAKILTLHLVNDLGSDSDSGSQSDVPSNWPGTPVSYDFNNMPQLIQPVWIGVSEDGTDNQHYPIDTPLATIQASGWTHIYQGTEIVGQDGNVEVFSDNYDDLLAALDACCGNSFPSALFALKISRPSLAVTDPNPPCGADAAFKWLAVYGKDETSTTMTYTVLVTLTPADGNMSNAITFQPFLNQPFTETLQWLKRWPTDFIGMTSLEGITLVGPTAEPGPTERRVSFFDGGTINIGGSEYDDLVPAASGTWRLPGTICTTGCSTLDWSHIDNVFGLLEIKVNDEAIVYSIGPESGSFKLKAGDEVECTVTDGDAINRLHVSEETDGDLFDDNTPPGPVTFTFTAACFKAYTVEGRTQGGE